MSYTNGIGDTGQAMRLLTAASATGTTQAKMLKETSKSKAAKEVDVAAGGSAIASSEARLSSTAGILTQTLSGSDTRAAQVEALQKAIAAGTYNVSADVVADKLIDSMVR